MIPHRPPFRPVIARITTPLPQAVPHNNRTQDPSEKQLAAHRFVCIPIHFSYKFHTFPVHSFDSLPPIFGTSNMVELRCRTKEGDAHEKIRRRVPGRPWLPRRAAAGGPRAMHVRDAGRRVPHARAAPRQRELPARVLERGVPQRAHHRTRSLASTRLRRSSTGGSRSSSNASGARRTTSASANGGRSSPSRGARFADTTR